MENMQGSTNMFASTMNYWTPDNQNAPLPRPLRSKAVMRVSNQYVENGSYVRLKNLTIGYTLPSEWTKKITINNLRFFVAAQNLFTITGYSGMNPEVDITGWDKGTEKFWSDFYPVVRTWTLGMQFNF